MHYLFANIISLKDIDNAVNRLVCEGLISDENEKIELTEFVTKSLNNENVKRWFEPGIKLFNECNIIFKDENGVIQTKRPDRVMMFKEIGRAHV